MSVKLWNQQRIQKHHGTRRERELENKRISSLYNWWNLRGENDWGRFYRLLPPKKNPNKGACCLECRTVPSAEGTGKSAAFSAASEAPSLGCHRTSHLAVSLTPGQQCFLLSPRSKMRTNEALGHIDHTGKGQGKICNGGCSTGGWKHLAYTF